MRKSRFLLVLSLAVVLHSCSNREERAASGLARRIVPAYASRIRFVQVPDTVDIYELSAVGDRIVIKGSNAVSMAVGLNRYLQDYCHTTVSWYASDPVEVPEVMPSVSSPVRGRALVPDRFFLNYCTFGYTMPWWQWADWERLVDWMALNGVNMPLAITGQEAVWQKVWRSYGLTDEEIRSYFTGPAHLPWHRMNNIDRFDGPLPQGWIDGQVDLQRQILARERELGMRPVLPAFAGHVPARLREIYPEAKISLLSRWGGFPDENRCSFLSSTDSLYGEIQTRFLKEQTRLFGTDHLYGFDLFNEVEAPSWDPETLADISRRAYGSVSAVDPDATWIQMGWLFHYDRKHWTPDIMRAYLQAVPQGRVVLLDYYTEHTPVWKGSESFFGQPYIFCYLGNFGGNTVLAGDFREIGRRINEALAEGGSNLTGIGSTLEGFGVNQPMYEFVLSRAWDAGQDDEAWITSLADRHLGHADVVFRTAWQEMVDQIYVRRSTTQCSLIAARPSLEGHWWWTAYYQAAYDNADLVRIWKEMLDTPADRRTAVTDVVTVGSQALGNAFAPLRDAFTAAYRAGDLAVAETVAGRICSMVADVDSLLSCEPQYRLETWLDAASAWGTTPEEAAYFRQNARRILTTWGEPSSLRDYASRLWSGLTMSFYGARWTLFTDEVLSAMRAGKPFDEKAFFAHCEALEDAWVLDDNPVRSPDPVDPYTLSRRLIERYDQTFRNTL